MKPGLRRKQANRPLHRPRAPRGGEESTFCCSLLMALRSPTPKASDSIICCCRSPPWRKVFGIWCHCLGTSSKSSPWRKRIGPDG